MDCPNCREDMKRVAKLGVQVDAGHYRGETWKCAGCGKFFSRHSFTEEGGWSGWTEVKAGTPPPLPFFQG